MSAKIYIEGGGDSKELRIRCREGFRRLLDQCGFTGRMPKLIACGGRDATFAVITTLSLSFVICSLQRTNDK